MRCKLIVMGQFSYIISGTSHKLSLKVGFLDVYITITKVDRQLFDLYYGESC